MRVTVQFQRGYAKTSPWVDAYVARVLYADKEIILTRGAGAHQAWYNHGGYRCAAYSLKHPVAQKVPKKATGWRLHPSSLERIKAAL